MAPAHFPVRSLRVLIRTLAVLLVSIATPLSLAVSPDDSPVSRKLDHVRATRVGTQRPDMADAAAHHDIGAGPDLIDISPLSDVVVGVLSQAGQRLAPPSGRDAVRSTSDSSHGLVAVVPSTAPLPEPDQLQRLNLVDSVSPLHSRTHQPSRGRAPPTA